MPHRSADADAARSEFERLGNRPDDADSRKTLEAWVLLMRGDAAGARVAAQAVDTTRDGDVQDRYVVMRALASGGDTEGAARVRELIRNTKPYPMKPVILRAMQRDATRAK